MPSGNHDATFSAANTLGRWTTSFANAERNVCKARLQAGVCQSEFMQFSLRLCSAAIDVEMDERGSIGRQVYYYLSILQDPV